jgi:hypothetical protein
MMLRPTEISWIATSAPPLAKLHTIEAPKDYRGSESRHPLMRQEEIG